MKKFSIILEQIENGRFFKVDAQVQLIVEADNEGEAGYLADSILGSVENGANYQILNIDQTEERIEEHMELYPGKQGVSNEPDRTPEEVIEMTWEAEFGDNTTTMDEKMEFYHNMRKEGYDGDVIFKALKNKF